MSPDQIKACAEEAFNRAIELSPDERMKLLLDLDPAVRSLVEQMLERYGMTSGQGELDLLLWLRVSAAGAAGTQFTIGRYRLVTLLDVGGSSLVFKAKFSDELGERSAAVKLLDKRYVSDPQFRARFGREARILFNLTHEYIVRLYHAEVATLLPNGVEMAYLATELVEGVTLKTYCKDKSKGTKEKLEVFIRVCSAVSYAHLHGVIHRDLKPANILVSASGSPRLLDFGISALLEEEDQIFTQTGQAFMTPEYASPEQILDPRVQSPSTDIFSLGVVLYELLSGKRPFQRATRDELRRPILDEHPPNLTLAADPIDETLWNICSRALEKDTADRFQSVEQLSTALQMYLQGHPCPLPPKATGQVWRRTFRTLRSLRASASLPLVSLAVMGLGVVWFDKNREAASFRSSIADLSEHGALREYTRQGVGTMHKRLLVTAKALERADVARSSDERAKHELASVHYSLANMEAHPSEHNLGKSSLALEHIDRSVGILSTLKRGGEDGFRDTILLANTRITRGTLLIEQGRYGEAQKEFEHAALVQEREVSSPHGRIESSVFANVLAGLSRIKLHERDLNATLSMRERVVSIRERICTAVPTDGYMLFYLSGSLSSYGWALREAHRFDGAKATYIRAQEVLSKISDLPRASFIDISTPKARNDYELGRIALERHALKEAYQHFASALTTFERLAAIDEDNISNRRYLALALSQLAAPGFQQHFSPIKRQEMGRQALALVTAAVAIDPANAVVRNELAEIRGRLEKR